MHSAKASVEAAEASSTHQILCTKASGSCCALIDIAFAFLIVLLHLRAQQLQLQPLLLLLLLLLVSHRHQLRRLSVLLTLNLARRGQHQDILEHNVTSK